MRLITLPISTILIILMACHAYAEENKGFNLSNIFKINKAEEKEKFIPLEKEKKEALILTGSAGPKMPAVPAGSIKKEVIVKTSLPPKTSIIEIPKVETKRLSPVTVSYNPKIPFTTLIFQNSLQKNLEPGHLDILKDSLDEIKNGHYRGKIQIKSFSNRGHQSAIDRAKQVREFMISNGISIRDLDVQALPTETQGNTIHIFLLGEI